MMDQRELETNVKALTKCIQANEPAENALNLLDSLKKNASPTEEMLRVGCLVVARACRRSRDRLTDD